MMIENRTDEIPTLAPRTRRRATTESYMLDLGAIVQLGDNPTQYEVVGRSGDGYVLRPVDVSIIVNACDLVIL